MIDAGSPPKLWVPPKPAVIRAASTQDVERAARKATFPFPIVPPSGGKVLTFQGSAANNSDLAIYTFAAQAIGAAAADRRVIVGVAGMGVASGMTLSSATIGGTAATIVAQSTVTTCCVGMIIALVPTGTTAGVVVTFSATVGAAAIGVWTCTGLSSNTAHHFGTSTADPASVNLNTLAGGFAVGFIAQNNGSTYGWTNLTERLDADTGETRTYGGADSNGPTSGSSLAISCTYSLSSAPRGMVAASW